MAERPVRLIRFERRKALAGVLMVLGIAALTAPAQAANVYWNTGTANWSAANSWTPSEPTLNDNAYINNGGTAQITAGNTEYADDLYLGDNAGQSGHVQMFGGALFVEYDQYIGYEGTGTFNQSGGENRCSYGVNNHDLFLGYAAGGSGTYTMTGGTLHAGDEYIGRLGTGTFLHSGGTNYVSATGSLTADNLYLGYATSSARGSGRYRLSGTGEIVLSHKNANIYVGREYSGTVSQGRFEWFRLGGITWSDPSGTGRMEFGPGGTLAMGYDFSSIPSRVIGLESATLEVTNGATVTKNNDGITSVVNHLRIGSETGAGYGIQNGGTVQIGQSATIGDKGTGVATQHGGSFQVTTHLYLGVNSPSASGTYRLNGGTLAVGSNIFGGAGTSALILDGGTLSLGGNLLGYRAGADDRRITSFIIGDAAGRSGSFTLASGKTANLVAMTVGNLGTGTFSQAGAVNAESLTIGAGSSYTMTDGTLAVSGAVIVGQGGAATFDIGSRSPTVGSLTMRNGSITGTGTITASSGYTAENGTIGAKLGGSVGLLKTTAGNVTLSGANTYTGTTTLRAGTLTAGTHVPYGAAGALGNATSAIAVGDANTQPDDNLSLLVNGAYSVGRAITVNNYGNIVTLGGNNTSGTATFSGNITIGRDVNLSAGGGSGGTVQFTGLLSGSGKTATLAGSGNVKVAPASAGTTNANYTVATGGGRLLGGTNTSGTVQFTGNITLNKEVTLSAASGGMVEFLTGAWTTNNNPVTVTGAGTSVVRLSNTLNTTAAVNVASGSLRVDGAVGGGGSAVTVASGAALRGTGAINKPVIVNGTIDPGASTGVLTVNNSLTLAGISHFELQAYRPEGPGAGYYDGILVGGSGNTLSFGGTLNVVHLGGGPVYANGQVYDLFDWGGNTAIGTFSTINLPSLGGGLQWKMFGAQPFDYSTGQIVVELGTEVTHYGLSAALAPDVLLNGYVGATSSITCTGSGNMDTLDFTGLSAISAPGGQIAGPPTSGTDVQHGETRHNTALTFRGMQYGNTTVVPTVATATNHNIGGNATLDWTIPAPVNVGQALAGPGRNRQQFGPPLIGQGELMTLPGGGIGPQTVRNYAGLASRTTPFGWLGEGQTLGTEAIIREGIDSTARNTASMAWRQQYDGPVQGEPGSEIPETELLVSDVLRLTGMDLQPGGILEERRQADVFVLQMSYLDPERPDVPHWLVYLDLGDDRRIGGVGSNGDRWLPAVLGNFNGSPGELVNLSWDDFRASNPGKLADLLGYQGWYDYGGGQGVAWAVVDYNNAQFAVVPEPSTWALLAVGAMGWLAIRGRARRRP